MKLYSTTYRLLFFFCFLSFSQQVFSQLTITPSNNELDPETLVKTIFLGDGVEVSNVTYTGVQSSIGYFTSAENEVGIERGLIMSSGNAVSASLPELGIESGITSGPSNDVDLEKFATGNLNDLATYEITFIPVNDTLQFKYVFASEEYPQYPCTDFNDVFGFFITGPDPMGGTYNQKNIALVPDPADPTGGTFTNTPVTITNVHAFKDINCPASFDMYYNNNAGSQNLCFGAYLDVFIAQAIVTPCEEYTIKLAIADVGDQQFDSAVFLEAKSFGTGSIDIEFETVSLDGSIAEGCEPSTLVFSLPKAPSEDLTIVLTTVDCNNNSSADPGDDYTGLPNEILFPAGVKEVSYEVYAIEDGITEGDESICFEFQRDICNLDTISFLIKESPIQNPILSNDTLICQNEIILLTSNLPSEFILPDPLTFTNSGTHTILDDMQSQSTTVNVMGVEPDILKPGMIESVCIDFLEARYLNDYDIFIQSPAGQFVELSTDNGNKPLNGQDIDTMLNTCFTPYAFMNINNGNPVAGQFFPGKPTYTGNFLPEGVWDDLYDGDNPSNGVWKLIFIDDETGGGQAILDGWSITFSPLYKLNYTWSSDVDGLICENCPEYPVTVAENTTYYLDMEDSYGCSTIDSFAVGIIPLLPPTDIINCDSVAPDYIRVTWADVIGASGYEISINGGPFVDAGLVTSFEFLGLESNKDFTIEIRALGGVCGGEVASSICTTPSCLMTGFTVQSITPVSCFGSTDGSIDVVVTGNFPPFTYELDGQTNITGQFQNLSGGVDSIFITDDVGCINGYEIEIESPGVIASDIVSLDDIACFGENSGAATLNVTGGNGAKNITWESGEIGTSATMLSLGWNTYTITDENNCTRIDSVFIDTALPLSANHLAQAASCFGVADGAAIMNVTGGNPPFLYAWGDANNQMTKQAVNLVGGTYMVTITDDKNCMLIYDVFIDSPAEIETVITGSNIDCASGDFGSASLQIIGGNAPYDVVWSSGEITELPTQLMAGWNFVTITDNLNCPKVDSVFIDSPNAIEIEFMEAPISCFNGSDGQISFVITGGTGPYDVILDGIPVTSPVIDLNQGLYCFTVTDSADCTYEECYDLVQPEQLTWDSDIIPENCIGSFDGSIDISIMDGVGPYQFNWEGPGGFTSMNEDLTGLTSGSYMFTVTDANQCSLVDAMVLNQPMSVEVTAVVINIPCKGEETGVINVTVSSQGQPPFMFSWTGPSGFTSNEEDLVDIPAGTYNLIFEDASGCVIQKEYEIVEPATALTSNISPDDEICFGAKNGIASVNPAGGTTPYSILWSTGSFLTSVNSLEPGTYTVTIIDGSLCQVIDEVEIIELDEIILSLDQTSSLCTDSHDGSASVVNIEQGGTNNNLADYSFLWNSFPIQNSPNAVGLKGGASYTVVVTDDLTCSAQATISIDNPEPVSGELLEIGEIKCANGNDGSLLVQGAGGVGNYTYAWGQGTNFQQGPEAVNLGNGNYIVTIADQNACTGIEIFSLQEPFPISLNYRIYDVLCKGEDSGEVELIANGGNPPYQFNWSTGDQDDVIENLVSGNYSITLVDDAGCVQIDTILVDEPQEGIDIQVNMTDITCFEGQDGRIEIDATGGSGNYLYSLDNFLYNGAVEQIGLRAGTYTVYVKDGNGCLDSLDNIEIFEPDEFSVDLGEDKVIMYGTSVQLNSTIENANGTVFYDWNSDVIELLSCEDCPGPFYEGIKPGTVRLYITDANGCRAEDLINIYIEDLNVATVPTAFTPNGDFNNDLLNVYGLEGTQVLSFAVYDRWGEKVFEAFDFEVNDETIGWDGEFRGSPMDPGVFIWVVEVESQLGFNEIYKGNTSLIR